MSCKKAYLMENKMNVYKFIISKCVFVFIIYFFESYSQSLDSSINSNLLEQLFQNQIISNDFISEFSSTPEYERKEDRLHNLTEDNIEIIRNYLLSDLKKDSYLEKEYIARARTNLSLVGYDMFQKLYDTNLNSQEYRAGGVQDNYIIGQGDEIIIQLTEVKIKELLRF